MERNILGKCFEISLVLPDGHGNRCFARYSPEMLLDFTSGEGASYPRQTVFRGLSVRVEEMVLAQRTRADIGKGPFRGQSPHFFRGQ